MKTVSLATLRQQTSARKLELGLRDTPAEVEAMRNKGANRTPEKRELLRRAEQRAKLAGVPAVAAYF